MSSSTHFDAIVIGSGQSGTPLASAFTKSGKKTALIEREHIGGCCVNVGCTPTKTMIASGRVAYLASRASKDFGVKQKGTSGEIEAMNPTVDMQKVRQRKRDIVNSFRIGGEARTRDAGVEVFMGEASFKDANTLAVVDKGGETTLTATTIVINTGERPADLKLAGLANVEPSRILDSTSIQELDEVPSHLIVLGGGYIGLEFGQLFRRLGSKVSIVQRGKQLLPREDAEIARAMYEILREDDVDIYLQTTASGISSTGSSNYISLHLHSEDGRSKTITASHLLLATGRTPNTSTLNLSAAGIQITPKGHIPVSPTLQTTVPHIYALGDVKGGPAFTHISYDDFRILKANLLDGAAPELTTTDRFVPYVVYTDPQLGHVGLHEAEARAKYSGSKIMTASMPMTYVARALETDETRGMMKAVVDSDSGQILGFTCLGTEGGEVMSVVQMAMMGKVPWTKLQDAVFAHPTLAESLNNLWAYLK